MGLPDLVKACNLFVYLNVQFRSFQFEEVQSTFVANIHQSLLIVYEFVTYCMRYFTHFIVAEFITWAKVACPRHIDFSPLYQIAMSLNFAHTPVHRNMHPLCPLGQTRVTPQYRAETCTALHSYVSTT